jgi:hypothetical protein
MENNDRVNVREKTVDNEKDIAGEGRQTKMPDRVHAKPRQYGGRGGKAEHV